MTRTSSRWDADNSVELLLSYLRGRDRKREREKIKLFTNVILSPLGPIVASVVVAVLVLVLAVDRFYIALFSAFEQTRMSE